jgi:hypothetical protein
LRHSKSVKNREIVGYLGNPRKFLLARTLETGDHQEATAQTMIQAVLIFNNKGLPRLTKFYSTTPTPHLQQLLIAEIFSLVSKRPPGSCNFLEGSQMLGGDDVRIIYRHYATLYFVFVVEESESELGILDLIQVPHSF